NLAWDTPQANVLDLAAGVGAGNNNAYCPQGVGSSGYCNAVGGFVIFNNTMECGPDNTSLQPFTPSAQCTYVPSNSVMASTLENNHGITSNSTPWQCQSGAVSC